MSQDESPEPAAVSGGEETPIEPDPQTVSDQGEGEEFDDESPVDLSTTDLRIQSSITDPDVGRRGGAKPSPNKQQVIESKLQALRRSLNPIPFIPHKNLDFAHHEKLLKKLGLWEFVHIDLDRTIRADFIAQLVANYDAELRATQVNGCRIMVNRTDLARAFKLPSPEEESNGGAEVDLDWERFSDDSIGFLLELLSDWVLLHEDMWLMPDEVADWMNLIKEERPEKVDWPGLLWFMVEEELKQGSQLRDCHYASHLQHLLKFQCESLFLIEDPDMDEVEFVAEVNKEVKYGEGDSVVREPNTELALGQDDEDLEMVDAEKCKDSEEEQDQEQWLLSGKDNLVEHVLQCCSAEDEEMDEEEEDGEDDEEVARNNFHEDSLGRDEFTGNFLQGLEGNQMASVDGRVDLEHISELSFFNHSGKRVIEDDYHNPVNDSNKRLRINETWDNKPLDFAMCMNQMQQVAQRARMLYEEKVQVAEQLDMNKQILVNELQKRDAVIDHLHEEIQKKDFAVSRLERELYLMGSVLDGYRKALKETRKVFAEYKDRAQLPEEPTYKDAGSGGLMLTAAEIERRRKKEEEFKMNCLYLEQMMKVVEEEYVNQYADFADKINLLDKKLIGLEADAKELITLHSKKKSSSVSQQEDVPQAAEALVVPDSMEEEGVRVEVSEHVLVPEPEEQVSEAAADHQPDEKVVEVAEPLSVE